MRNNIRKIKNIVDKYNPKINLTHFRSKYPQYKTISDNWFTWFIGFFEGDGCLTIGKSNIEIVITQSELDKNILMEMQDTFGFGQINVQKKLNTPGKL